MGFEDHESMETKKIHLRTHHDIDFEVNLHNFESVTHFGCKNWEAFCKMYGFDEGMLVIMDLAKCFLIFATKMGYTLNIVQLYLKIHTMMGP